MNLPLTPSPSAPARNGGPLLSVISAPTRTTSPADSWSASSSTALRSRIRCLPLRQAGREDEVLLAADRAQQGSAQPRPACGLGRWAGWKKVQPMPVPRPQMVAHTSASRSPSNVSSVRQGFSAATGPARPIRRGRQDCFVAQFGQAPIDCAAGNASRPGDRRHPPWPAARASAAAKHRRPRSSRTSSSAPNRSRMALSLIMYANLVE